MASSSAICRCRDVTRITKQNTKQLRTFHNCSAFPCLTAPLGYWIFHQDYGWSNGQMGPGGVWIIDLDGVAYDLAIRDLRKLITSTMDDMGVWDPWFMKGMIDAYNKSCRIEPDLYQVLLIDMALPNEFYKHVKEMVFDPAFLNVETDALLHRLVETDATKWAALKELGLKWEGSAK